MGCASSKKRTTSVDDLTGAGGGGAASDGSSSSKKKKNGQLNDSRHKTGGGDTAIQINPGASKSFMAPDGIPFIDEDVDDEGAADIGPAPVKVGNATTAKAAADVNRNVVVTPGGEQHQQRAPDPITSSEPTFLSKDADSYAKWLKVSLKLLHNAVYKNRIESKQQMKEKYDKRHNVKEPDF